MLYGREHLLSSSLPFLYGGDMIAEGRVLPRACRVQHAALEVRRRAHPNILGAIVSAQALRLLLDLALTPRRPAYFRTGKRIERAVVGEAMNRISRWNRLLTGQALDGLAAVDGLRVYGPGDADRRTSLVAFNIRGRDPMSVAEELNRAGVESRAGCHCATLAHHALGLTPAASCRLSFYLYNTPGEVDQAVAAVAAIAAGRGGRIAAGRGGRMPARLGGLARRAIPQGGRAIPQGGREC